jgi:predicted transcriptional regulator YheO
MAVTWLDERGRDHDRQITILHAIDDEQDYVVTITDEDVDARTMEACMTRAEEMIAENPDQKRIEVTFPDR